MTSNDPGQPASIDHDTVLVAAFEGWNDAGAAASAAVLHLVHAWDAIKVDELDPEDYHDFQVNRPITGSDVDGNRTITWPTTAIYVARHPATGRRIVLVHGPEPSTRWRSFCNELLDFARELDAKTIITLGALLADVPHTRTIPVTATSHDPALQAILNIEPSAYEGPTGIVGILQHMAAEQGIRGLSLWAAVPHYVAHPPSPKVTLAILRKIETILAVAIPMDALVEDAETWQTGVDELAVEDPEISEYVAQLEQTQDTAELPEATGEAIAREFERYLKGRGNGEAP